MIVRGLTGVEFLVCNTDAQHIATTLTENRLQLGRDITQGRPRREERGHGSITVTV
jgi:cell division protein FtsZ